MRISKVRIRLSRRRQLAKTKQKPLQTASHSHHICTTATLVTSQSYHEFNSIWQRRLIKLCDVRSPANSALHCSSLRVHRETLVYIRGFIDARAHAQALRLQRAFESLCARGLTSVSAVFRLIFSPRRFVCVLCYGSLAALRPELLQQ